jgi:hypothetical protein
MSKPKSLSLKIELNRGWKQLDKSKPSVEDKEVISVRYGDKGWFNFLENIGTTGALSAKVVKAFTPSKDKDIEGEATKYDQLIDHDVVDSINVELEKAFGKDAKPLTADQQRIADLEAKIDALMNASQVTIDPDGEVTPEMIEEYTALVNKPPHKNATFKSISERIAAEKAKQV